MAMETELEMSLPVLSRLSFAVQLLPLAVVLIPLLYVLMPRKDDRPGKSDSMRYLKSEGLGLFEAIVEWVATMVTTLIGRAYRCILAHTRGATVIRLPGKRIIVAHPSVERVLSKHGDSVSLAHNLSFFGNQMFDLSADGIQRVTEYDWRPVFRDIFSKSSAVRELVKRATDFAQIQMDREPDVQETMLGAWLFKMVNTALITAIWGPENPWVADEDCFWDCFIAFRDTLPKLLRPWPGVTARPALKAREAMVSRLRKFYFENRASLTKQLAHRINIVATTDPSWESNPDYFGVELITVQGLTVSPAVVTVWLVRHLLADERPFRRVVSQVRSINAASLDSEKMDAGHIHRECPMLVASAYEAMRLHMTAIPRVATQDIQMPVAGAASGPVIGVKKGDMIVLPMTSFNLDPAVWGSDVARFAPERFLTQDGSVSEAAVRRLRVFGVAGNMCPGRKMGLSAVLSVAATVLRTFDIERGDDRGPAKFPPPAASQEPGIGIQRVAEDVRATIRRIRV